MELSTRIELVILSYQDRVIPFNYKSELEGVLGIEPRTTESKSVVIPFHHTPLETGGDEWNRTTTIPPYEGGAQAFYATSPIFSMDVV